MTLKEFNKIPFTSGMTASFKGKEFPIVSCDFEDKLIAVQMKNMVIWIDYKKLKYNDINISKDTSKS